jgi:hypothetical protein
LLHAAAGFFHGVETEPDHVERVEHGCRVDKLIVHGVGVPAERVQRGDLHPAGELAAAATQPVRVAGAGTAGNQVEQRARPPCSAWRDRSTIPVISFGPLPVCGAWCQLGRPGAR